MSDLTSRASLPVEPSRSASHPEVLSQSGDSPPLHVEVIKHLVKEAGFLGEVAEVVAKDL